jgi:hypothetical protein
LRARRQGDPLPVAGQVTSLELVFVLTITQQLAATLWGGV